MEPPAAQTKSEAEPERESSLPPDHAASDATAHSPPPPTAQKSVSWSRDLTQEAPPAPSEAAKMPEEPNPYVATPSPAPSKNTMETVKNVLARWGKKVGEATRKTEDLAGNMWQHLKTGPSLADAAMGRIAQGTKVIAEGGYEKIFQQTFGTISEEKLTSDNPLSYKVGDQTEWSYYKVVIPLHQLRAVNPSASKTNRAEKYIQIVSVDDHEFWFMGFVNYDSAVKNLQDALDGAGDLHP